MKAKIEEAVNATQVNMKLSEHAALACVVPRSVHLRDQTKYRLVEAKGSLRPGPPGVSWPCHSCSDLTL